LEDKLILKYLNLHSWEVNPKEAIQLQRELKKKISLKKSFSKIKKVAGADVSYYKNKMIAGVIVFEFPNLKAIEKQSFISPVNFPYIPGLLTFREGPSILAAFKKIKNEPDIILFDGQGIAHPRRMGIATHLGLFLDKPTIGCAKSRLSGKYTSVGEEKGDYAPLKEGEEILGAVLRTRKKVKPIFVSPGYKIDLSNSIEIVLKCTDKYKLPVPVREAHLFVNQIRNKLTSCTIDGIKL
jgi:deoxyribonuclease V